MDVYYINPFVAAVKTVFATMLDADLLVGKARLRNPSHPSADVSAVIGFTGSAAGSVALCFSKSSAVNVASRFAGAKLSLSDTAELADALGELVNMVAGQAKLSLSDNPITISLPLVILGLQHRLLDTPRTSVVVLPCDSSLGRFAVEAAMELKNVNPYAVESVGVHQDSPAAP